MGKAIPTIVGTALMVVGAAMAFLVFGPGALVGAYLFMAGFGTTIASLGTLLTPTPQGGMSTAARNPVMPWNVIYGRCKTGGTIVFFNEFGDDNKYLDIVIVIASHPCQSIDALLFDNQRVLINPANQTSYSPTQQTIDILSIARSQGIVTVHLATALGDLQDGDQVEVRNVHGQSANDKSLNGRVYVSVIDSTHFTYLSGGLDVSLGTTGEVKTHWADYRSKVYCEYLLGDQAATFTGMIPGTPFDGVPGFADVAPADNPWTTAHVLSGRTCAFLRLHYNDEVFSGGLPQISFRVHGKTNIYDPREGDTVLGRPTVLLNGWGPNEHEGMYEGGVDQGSNWGLDSGTTYPYGSPEYATDGNFSSYANIGYRHTHKYAGCIWTFGSIDGAAYLNVLSEVPSFGPGALRSAGIFYSLDDGATWDALYDAPTRARWWDSLSLPIGQDTTAIQVMAFLDSHDDMAHFVYDIHLGSAPASFPGYSENPALCIADYLSNVPYGFRASYGSEIPAAQLITAANICDEEVALAGGGTEPRYTLNGQFQLSTSRGEVLQNMLTSCAGRLTYSGGEFVIHPAAWTGPTITIGGGTPTSALLTVQCSYTDASSTDVAPTTNAFIIGYPNASSVTASGDHYTLALTDGASINVFNSTGLTAKTVAVDPADVMNPDFVVNATILTDPGIGGSPIDNAQLSIYDCYVDFTYADSTTKRYRPTEAVAYPAITYGTLTNPDNAIDGDLSDAAVLTRTVFTPDLLVSGVHCPILQFRNFTLGGTGGGDAPPDLTAVAGSKEALALTAGSFRWNSKVAIRDLYNGVKGTYISPANGWQNSDFPPYAQDEQHGYASDANLAADGGDRRWLELQLPFTISPAMAQRLAKIELLRRRQQGSGTFAFNLSLYKTTALDVISLTLPILGWNGKLLEVGAHRLVFNRDQETPFLSCELDLRETTPSVYEWSTTEEVTPQGVQQSVLPSTGTPQPPTDVDAVSGSSTSVVGADGVARSRILTTWTPPADGYVLNGGHIEVQYQKSGDTAWTGLPSVDPSVTQVYIDGVTDGQSYVVQVRSVNAAGVPSAWVAAAPVTVSGTATVLPPSSISGSGASSGDVLVWNGTGWVPGTPTPPTQPYDVICTFVGKAAANGTVLIVTFTRAVTFPANFGGSRGTVGVNPTAAATYAVSRNGTAIGTVAISTAGVFTFTTTGGAAQSFIAGDRLVVVAPSTQDATLADVAITFAGTR